MELERSDPRGGLSVLDVREGPTGDRVSLGLHSSGSGHQVYIQLTPEDVDNLTIMLQYYKQEILTEGLRNNETAKKP